MRKIEENWLRQKYLEDELTTYEIAEELGVSQGKVSYWLRKHGIPTRMNSGGGDKLLRDLTGKRFGRLLVKRLDSRAGENCNRKTMWECECNCGKTVYVWSHSLTHKSTQSCGCLRRDKMFQGCGDLSSSYWNRILKGANKRKLSVEIDIEFAWGLYLKQNKTCALSGLPILIHRDYTRHHDEHTASLDRINNNHGYTENNVQWLHRVVNKMKGTLSQEEFIDFCRRIGSVSKTPD